MKPQSKVVASNPGSPERSAERAALAAAIARVTEAEADLAATHEAASVASRRRHAAQDALDAARAGAAGQIDAAAFIAQVRAGDAEGVEAWATPAAKQRADEETAANQVQAWRQAYEACQAQIPAKESELDWARDGVKRAAQAVLRAGADAAGLMDGIEKLQAELNGRRAALRFLHEGDLIEDPELKSRVRAFLGGVHLMPALSICPHPAGFDGYAGHRIWTQAQVALRTDPDAPVPSSEAVKVAHRNA